MSALDKTPDNINYLSPLGYHFFVKKLPNVNFFVQHVQLPSVTLPAAQHHVTPLVHIHQAGDHLQYSELNIQFKLDENMENYMELYDWMQGLGFPIDSAQYKTLLEKNQHIGDGLKSDISVIMLTNLKNANIEYTFIDAWPTFLGNFALRTTDTDVKYIDCQAAFKFTYFTVKKIPK